MIEIRTLIQHPMETGYRPGPNGRMLPRDIIRRFTCAYDGEVVFSAELHPAIAANPFIVVHDRGHGHRHGDLHLGGRQRLLPDRDGNADRGMRRGRRGRLVAARLAGAGAGARPVADRRPGFDFLGPQTRAMQEDDTLNPGMLWVLDGEEQWRQPSRRRGQVLRRLPRRCRLSMRGVAARYPAFDADRQAADLARGADPGLPPRPAGSAARRRRATTGWRSSTFVAHQSRGMPIAVGDDERLQPFIARGRELFERRQGQLDLVLRRLSRSPWGQRLGGSVIPQGHPTGYPIYRLEWQALGSLQRRLRNCMELRTQKPPPCGLELGSCTFSRWPPAQLDSSTRGGPY